MAIQHRRGNEVDFQISKIRPGEACDSLDVQKEHIGFGPGKAKTVLFQEDVTTQTTKIAQLAIKEAEAWAHGDSYEEYDVNADGTALVPSKTIDTSKDNAKYYSGLASASEVNAKTSETNAKTSETNAKTSETNAKASESNAGEKSTTASNSAILSESYAKGGTNSRTGEDTDNAAYFYEKVKNVAESINGLSNLGTCKFEELPAVSTVVVNGMYNISNEFTTTAEFEDGAGLVIPLGSNIIKTKNNKWDVMAGSPVAGVKGDKETTYRRGNVNITPENIGAAKSTDLGDLTTTGVTGSSASEQIKTISSSIGDLKTTGVTGDTASDQIKQINTDFTDKGTVITDSNTIAAKNETVQTVCSINLKPNKSYLVISNIYTNVSINTVYANNLQYGNSNSTVRGNASMGGGILNAIIVNTGSSNTTVSLNGYISIGKAACNFIGIITAIEL